MDRAAESSSLIRQIVVIGLLVATIVYVAVADDLCVDETAGLQMALPGHAGSWTGSDILFCQNRSCAAEFEIARPKDGDRCRRCDDELHVKSIGERRILPEDTEIARKLYRDPVGRSIALSIVQATAERTGIHPPEWCLKAQGYKITRREIMMVPFANRPPLKLALLDLERSRDAGSEAIAERRIYAFWYVSRGRETSSHVGRLGWITYDAIVNRVARRWAYVGLLIDVHGERRAIVEQLSRFISEVYPVLLNPAEA